MLMSLKQEYNTIQFEPRIKLNHNMYIIQRTGNENIHTYQVEVMILIQPQILVTNLQGNVWQLVGRINNPILGVKELMPATGS